MRPAQKRRTAAKKNRGGALFFVSSQKPINPDKQMENRLPNPNAPARERIGWVDLLRVTACFLVVFSHCCDPFVGQFDNDRAAFLTGAFSGSFVRCCVPLFVMMTGVLLLPVKTGLAGFYRQAHRTYPRSTRFLVGRAAAALLRLPQLRHRKPEPGDRPRKFHLGRHAAQTLDIRIQFHVRHYAVVVPLHARRAVFDHARDQRMARKGLAQRTQNVARRMGRDPLLPYAKMFAPMLGYTGNFGNMGLYGVATGTNSGRSTTSRASRVT